LGLALLAAAVVAAGLSPVLWARGACPPAATTPAGGWSVYRGASFDVVYPSRLGNVDAPVVARLLEEAASQAAGFLGPAAGRPAGLRLVVVLDAAGRSRPAWLEGMRAIGARAGSEETWLEAAAAAVLAGTSGRGTADPGAAAALAACLTPEGREECLAVAAALDARGRLASVPQLMSWWPSLPLAREQLGSLLAYVESRWGQPAARSLLGNWPGPARTGFGDFERRLEAALGGETTAAGLDLGWVAHVRESSSALEPEALESAARFTDSELGAARAAAIALSLLGVAVGAALLLALSAAGERRGGVFAVLAFALAACLELVLFTDGLSLWAKSAIALGEVVVFSVLAVALRRRLPRGHRDGPEPLAPSGRGLAELGITVAMFLMVISPRFGLYYYSREIWAKAPMMILALAFLVLEGRRGFDEVGLGRPGWRVVWMALAGVVAFRLTTGLTEAIYYGATARVTGLDFAWHLYEPWWRIGFDHHPYVAWPASSAVQDIWDFFFGNFAEELFFRGYLLSRLARSMGWWKALFAQAVLFGFFHVNYDGFPFDPLPMLFYVLMATAFGVLMGLLLRYSGTLLVPALVHPLSNLGVLWVGVTYTAYRGSWLTYLGYDPLEVVLGLVLIPLVLLAASGKLGTLRLPGRGPRLRSKGPYVEVPGG